MQIFEFINQYYNQHKLKHKKEYLGMCLIL